MLMLTLPSNWPYTPPNSEFHAKAPTKTQAIILGLGSMFNHSVIDTNVVWMRDFNNLTVVYKTARDIKQGEELCISYGDRLTFVDLEYEKWKKVQQEKEEAEERERAAKNEAKTEVQRLIDALPGDVDELDAIPKHLRVGDAAGP